MPEAEDQRETNAAGRFDLVVRGGEVFDPDRRVFARADVAVRGGRVVGIAPSLPSGQAAREVDASGKVVCPGLIDSHVHVYPLGHLVGVDPDELASRSGVTAFVDAGSTGALGFIGFRHYVLEPARSHVYALLNVSAIGLAFEGVRGLEVQEHDDLRLLHLTSAVEIVDRNRDRIVGIKVRMYNGLTSLAPVAAGRELADEVGLPLVVHAVQPPPSFRDILPYLRAGDVVTHVFHPGPSAVVRTDGTIRDDYREAKARGVHIDSGSARLFTSFPVIKAALAAGFAPDSISTDLTTVTVDQLTIDLPNTLSKFLALGLSLPEVLYKATLGAAYLLPPEAGRGRLAVGGPADMAVLEVEGGSFQYRDFFGNEVATDKRLVCRATILGGEVLARREHTALPYTFIRR
ncbi:MAG: amidohydrolase family protein [Chloroflexi bacterium]|nr:amidohydrolase family protein [Chloroflexota bacterium]